MSTGPRQIFPAMALPISATPILEGKEAAEFLRKALYWGERKARLSEPTEDEGFDHGGPWHLQCVEDEIRWHRENDSLTRKEGLHSRLAGLCFLLAIV